MPTHIISQDILDGFALLGLPVQEYTYNENPEDIIFAFTGNFKVCNRFKSTEIDTASLSNVSETMYAELGKRS